MTSMMVDLLPTCYYHNYNDYNDHGDHDDFNDHDDCDDNDDQKDQDTTSTATTTKTTTNAILVHDFASTTLLKIQHCNDSTLRWCCIRTSSHPDDDPTASEKQWT